MYIYISVFINDSDSTHVHMLFIYFHIVFPYVSFPVLHISTRQRVVRTGPAPGGRAVSNAEPRGSNVDGGFVDHFKVSRRDEWDYPLVMPK